MTTLLNARILASLGMIVFVGAIVASSTGAFFSDTETSTGNTFTAGDIDLQIDNESYALDCNIAGMGCTGTLIFSTTTSWTMANLVAGQHRFFDFIDVKPGDVGEDTISIHVGSNDAWMCAAAQLTEDDDVTCTEPESADDPNCAVPGADLGELDDMINFAFWVDDGDNVFEPTAGASGTPETLFLQGPLSGLDDAGQIALSDSAGGAFGSGGIPGDSTVYIGKIWCAGTLTDTDLVQDGLTTRSPTGGTGFTCDGASVNNAAQTDSAVGDMQFYAVQKRNNPNFTCALNYTPTWPVLNIQAPQSQ